MSWVNHLTNELMCPTSGVHFCSLGDIPFDWRWIAAVIGFFLIWRLFSFGFAIVKFVIVAAIAAAIYAAVVGDSAGLAGGGSFFGF
ncbi:hypothetical protein ACJO17_18665 [Vibrio parahaemolyticus]|uniref:hypothetical protein n=1 Tax=Vibrio parahaemolyticus TaxID=670 RepID=UPI00387B7A9F